MRLKTLGVVLVTALSLFGVFYWITDDARRVERGDTQEQSLVHYGEELFGAPTDEIPFTANCAQCHGPEGRGGQVGDTGVVAPDLHSPSIAQKLQENNAYVELVIRFGGVVVSGNVESAMPAWSQEVGGPLNTQQIAALEALVRRWAIEAAEGEADATPVPNTVEAGREVYLSGTSPACSTCHGQDLQGGAGPALTTIGSRPVTENLPTPISGIDRVIEDYEEDPRMFLEQWIRDSAGNYNDGSGTGMPAYTPEMLSDDALQALITYLLDQTE